jgi:hypothetical protein
MILDVIDERRQYGTNWSLGNFFVVSRDYTIPDVMEEIIFHAHGDHGEAPLLPSAAEVTAAGADTGEPIWLLRIHAHGNTGLLVLGSTQLTVANAHHFSSIRSQFAYNSIGIEIHGCGVASSSPLQEGAAIGSGGQYTRGGAGELFLGAIARAARQNVTAGIGYQVTDHPNYLFEGPTITVTPQGTVYGPRAYSRR